MAKVKDWALENQEEREWYHNQSQAFLAWAEHKNPQLYERIISGEVSYQYAKRHWFKPFPKKKKTV